MKKKKKIIIAVIVLVLIVAVVFVVKSFSAKGETGLLVTTGVATKGQIEETVSIKGVIEGSDLAEVSSNSNLEVISISAKEGDKVTKGQTLAVLDSTSVVADYNKAVNNLEQSKFQYEASKTLYEEGAISLDELRKSELAFENDTISVSTFNKTDQSTVKSPITGTITRINTSVGRAANDTKDKLPMFVVEDLDNLQMNVKVSEYDINKIKLGQTVEITAEVLGEDVATGVVSKISPTGEQKEATSKEMVVPVTIAVDNANTSLLAGVSASAKILIERKDEALTVPVEAVMEDPETGKSYIFTVNKNLLKKIEVGVGINGNFTVEVISDKLKENDVIVLGPTFDMTDGMEVITAPQQG